MPLVLMLKTHSDHDCVLFAGRHYNIDDKLFKKLKEDRGEGPAFRVIRPMPGVKMPSKVHNVEVPDPDDDGRTHTSVLGAISNDPMELGKGTADGK